MVLTAVEIGQVLTECIAELRLRAPVIFEDYKYLAQANSASKTAYFVSEFYNQAQASLDRHRTAYGKILDNLRDIRNLLKKLADRALQGNDRRILAPILNKQIAVLRRLLPHLTNLCNCGTYTRGVQLSREFIFHVAEIPFGNCTEINLE